MPLLSVVAVRVIGVPSKAVPVSVMVTPLMPVSLPFTAASLAKSRNTVPAMDEALTTTGPELVLLSVICSIDEVLIVALLVKVWPLDDRVTTRTGTVISPTPPELKVPRSQVKDVPPAAPVQVVPVVVPAVTANVGVPVSSIPAGRVSVTRVSSASARPAPALLRTVMRKVKVSRRLTVAGVATLLAT